MAVGSKKTGRNGESITLEVPVGTTVRESSSGEVLADMVRHDQEYVVAKGGKGGRGNAMFATSTNQAPRTYEQGEEGKKLDLTLELKLLAESIHGL